MHAQFLSIRQKPWQLALIIVICAIALDFGTKVWAQQTLVSNRFLEMQQNYPACRDTKTETRRAHLVRVHSQKKVIIPNLFQFRYVENCGSSFNLMENVSERLRFPFFVFITLFACLVVPFLYLRTPRHQAFMLYALPLILAGAIGNLLDRIMYRYVVDFVDWFVVFRGKEYHWPTFNIADALILIGLGLMGVQLYRGDAAAASREAASNGGFPKEDGMANENDVQLSPKPSARTNGAEEETQQ
ncbi:MAG: signal peptidase II [Deltaproteobacteria bacterium]|nr:signal peptidase II [Deltaproteobacteria bacterium]